MYLIYVRDKTGCEEAFRSLAGSWQEVSQDKPE